MVASKKLKQSYITLITSWTFIYTFLVPQCLLSIILTFAPTLINHSNFITSWSLFGCCDTDLWSVNFNLKSITFHVNTRAGRNECCCMTSSREDKSRQMSFFSEPKQARLTAASTCRPTFSGFICDGSIWPPNGILSQSMFCTSIFDLSWLKVDLFPIHTCSFDQICWPVITWRRNIKKKRNLLIQTGQ